MIELLNMDCMDYLRDQPDKSFDLAVVDPPYGRDIIKTGKIGGIRKGQHKKWLNENVREYKPSKWDRSIPEENYFIEISRVCRNRIIWGGNYFLDYLNNTSSIVIWDKMNTGKFSDGELAWTSFGTSLRIYRHLWNGFAVQEGVVDRIHPTQKPIKLYEWLLKNYAEPGQRILDTHLGSGSSAIAAHYFGVDFVGIEIDEDYYNAALNRFNNETRQIALI